MNAKEGKVNFTQRLCVSISRTKRSLCLNLLPGIYRNERKEDAQKIIIPFAVFMM